MEKEDSFSSCQDPVTGRCNGAGRMHSSLLNSISRILILAFLPSGPVSRKWFLCRSVLHPNQWHSVPLSWLFYSRLIWVRSPAATVLLSLPPCPERPRRSHGLLFKLISLSIRECSTHSLMQMILLHSLLRFVPRDLPPPAWVTFVLGVVAFSIHVRRLYDKIRCLLNQA